MLPNIEPCVTRAHCSRTITETCARAHSTGLGRGISVSRATLKIFVRLRNWNRTSRSNEQIHRVQTTILEMHQLLTLNILTTFASSDQH
jgi:hypothetical protein